MNAKQRVQAAIARQPVDRVPLGLYCADCDTVARAIGRPTYVRNKVDTQIALWEGRRDEVAESLKKDTVEFYRKFDCVDILLPKEAHLLPPKDYQPESVRKVGDNLWRDERGCVYKATREANEIQCVYRPPEPPKEYTVADFENPLDATPPDASCFEVFDYVYEQLGAERYVASPTPGVTALTLLGGMENGLVLYALQPEIVLAASRRQCDWQNRMDRHYLRRGAPGALVGQDMAGTTGPLISPSMCRSMCLPFLKERISHIKRFVPQVILHNCGNNLPIMDQMVEAGADCYESIQTTPDMDIGNLKRLYGDKLCFWGGVPVETLLRGTPEEVRRAVRQALRIGAPGGGFILGPSHSIAYGTPYENFMAMLDEFIRHASG